MINHYQTACPGVACRRFCGFLAGILLAAGVALAGNAKAVETDTLLQACSACHGDTGPQVRRDIPVIQGQPFTVIDDALILFADGVRPCTVMCAIATALTAPEMEALANELERRAFVPAHQEFEPGLAVLGAEVHENGGCETCHSGGGRDGHGMAPILAGQWTVYLRQALHQIKAGERHGPTVMNRAIRSLSEGEIEALVNFYARQGRRY